MGTKIEAVPSSVDRLSFVTLFYSTQNTIMTIDATQRGIWLEKSRYDEAECQMYLKKYGTAKVGSGLGNVASQIAKARQDIQKSLKSGSSESGKETITISMEEFKSLKAELAKVTIDNKKILKEVEELKKAIAALTLKSGSPVKAEPVKSVTKEPEEDDDEDIDLFGSDNEEEDAEAARIKEERLKAYAEKKSKKPGPIAKSSVLLDVKPWDDETDMAALEAEVRKIQMDGLVWGAGKLMPLAYGIKKLSILCIVEDAKVSIDDLSEKIEEIEELVQSVDIQAFNKI